MLEATPAKLPDGTWGARVRGSASEGTWLTVSSLAGKVWHAKVVEVVGTRKGEALVRTKRAPRGTLPPGGLVGIHKKQPGGGWAVEVKAESLKEGDVIVLHRKDGEMWRAPVKRVLAQKPGVFVVDLGKKIRRSIRTLPSQVFSE